MGVWVRTSAPPGSRCDPAAETATPRPGRPPAAPVWNTGWVHLTDLAADTRYTYRVQTGEGSSVRKGRFRTLPSRATHRHPDHNPRGLFNFTFEVGACNFQYERETTGYAMPAYRTMRRRIEEKVHFQIMHGDFIYEARRDTSVKAWRKTHGVAPDATPRVLRAMPAVAGMWANYKL